MRRRLLLGVALLALLGLAASFLVWSTYPSHLATREDYERIDVGMS
jgi:hypothetical protein